MPVRALIMQKTKLADLWEGEKMATLNECKNELRSIINELRDIEWGVRHDFTGIGQDLCGDCIEKIASKYDGVLSRLNRVNTNRLADWILGR